MDQGATNDSQSVPNLYYELQKNKRKMSQTNGFSSFNETIWNPMARFRLRLVIRLRVCLFDCLMESVSRNRNVLIRHSFICQISCRNFRPWHFVLTMRYRSIFSYFFSISRILHFPSFFYFFLQVRLFENHAFPR